MIFTSELNYSFTSCAVFVGKFTTVQGWKISNAQFIQVARIRRGTQFDRGNRRPQFRIRSVRLQFNHRHAGSYRQGRFRSRPFGQLLREIIAFFIREIIAFFVREIIGFFSGCEPAP